MSSTSKTVLGRWAYKKWFTVHAPPMFNSVEVGEVPADEAEKLINRTLEITLFDLTRDLSHIHVKLRFQIDRVEGEHAYTRFKMLELTRDYIKSLVRRGSSKITTIHDVTTRDGAKLRITVLAVTAFRCKTSQKRSIRAITRKVLEECAVSSDFSKIIVDSVFGKISNDIFLMAKKIYPLRKVEIAKIKVLKYPEVKLEEVKPIEEKVVEATGEG